MARSSRHHEGPTSTHENQGLSCEARKLAKPWALASSLGKADGQTWVSVCAASVSDVPRLWAPGTSDLRSQLWLFTTVHLGSQTYWATMHSLGAPLSGNGSHTPYTRLRKASRVLQRRRCAACVLAHSPNHRRAPPYWTPSGDALMLVGVRHREVPGSLGDVGEPLKIGVSALLGGSLPLPVQL